MKRLFSLMSFCIILSLFGADRGPEFKPLLLLKKNITDKALVSLPLKLNFNGKVFELDASGANRFCFFKNLATDATDITEDGIEEIQMPVGTFDIMQKIIRKPIPDASEPLNLFSTEMILRDYLGDQTIHTFRDDMIEHYVRKIQGGIELTEPNMESDFGKRVKQRLIEEMGVQYPFNCTLPIMSLRIAHDKVLACSPHARYVIIEKNGKTDVVETSSKKIVHSRERYIQKNDSGHVQELIYFSDDDSHLIAHGPQSSDFVIVDLEKQIRRQSNIAEHFITSCALSPSKNIIAVGTHNSSVFLFEYATLECTHHIYDQTRILPINVIRFNRSGRYMFSASNRVHVWDVKQNSGRLIKDCVGKVTTLALSPDEKELKFAHINSFCRAYTVDFPECTKIEEHKGSDPIGHPDVFYGNTGLPLLIATWNFDHTSYKWACDKGIVYKVINLRTGSQSSNSIGTLHLKFSNGKFLKSDAGQGVVHIYDLEFSSQRKQLLMQLPCVVMRMMADINKRENQLLSSLKLTIDQELLETSIRAVDGLSNKEQSKDSQKLLSVIKAHLKRAQK